MLKSLRKKIISDLHMNRGQFMAVWIVVTLGVALYGAMYPSGLNMIASFYKTSDDLNYLDFQIQFNATDENLVEVANEINGVEEVESRLVVDVGLQPDPDNNYLITLRMISSPDDREPTVNLSNIVKGHEIQSDEEVLLLKTFADKHGYKVGDTLSVWVDGVEHTLTIAGLVFNPEYIILGSSPSFPFPAPSTFGVAWMRYTPMASLTGNDGLFNELVIHLEGKSSDENTELIEGVRQELREAFSDVSGLQIFARDETASGSVIQAQINGQVPVMLFFSGVFLLGSVVMTGVLLGRLVQSERRSIGTMRALGITRRELIEHYLSFGLIIGVTGGIVGSIFGYLNSFWVMAIYIQLIVGGTLPGFTNMPQWDLLLLGFVIAVTGTTLAGVYPAWFESATSPGIALRPAMPNNPGKLSRMASVSFLPLSMRQALRNLLRNPGRSLSTAFGVALGAMMIFSTYAMWDSFSPTVDEFYDVYDYDLRVDLQISPGDTIEENILSITGVQEVQAALFGPVVLTNEDGDVLDTIAISVDETNPFLHLKTLKGAEAFSSTEGIWVGNNVARILELDAGDTLTIEALGQAHDFKIMGIVSHIIGMPVFVPRGLMTNFMPGGTFFATSAFVRVDDGQINNVRADLTTVPGVVAVEVFSDFKADMQVYMLFFRVGTLIFGGFGYLLTFAVLFNTVNASLRERQNELSVLMALGNSIREITTVIVLELLIMIVIGGVIGLPIGREVGYYLISSYNSTAYNAIQNTTTLSYIIGSLSLVVIVLMSVIPGMRALRKVDLGQVSKSQSM
jgi:putative ABC transport system permease protein